MSNFIIWGIIGAFKNFFFQRLTRENSDKTKDETTVTSTPNGLTVQKDILRHWPPSEDIESSSLYTERVFKRHGNKINMDFFFLEIKSSRKAFLSSWKNSF